jgi:hypothetical protein
MRLILVGQAEWLGSEVSGPDGWWRMSGKYFNPAQLPRSVYRVRIACDMDSCSSVVSRVKMQCNVHQRYAIKFCVKLEKSETLAMIQNAHGKDALSKAQVFRWHKDRALSGTLASLLEQRKLEWANQKWNCCSLFSFCIKCVVHREFVPPGQTVNTAFYVEVL